MGVYLNLDGCIYLNLDGCIYLNLSKSIRSTARAERFEACYQLLMWKSLPYYNLHLLPVQKYIYPSDYVNEIFGKYR